MTRTEFSRNLPAFVVVIRTAGERTFDSCKQLTLQQIPQNVLYVVHAHPFEATLRQCYQIGIESGAEWMITLDADVLLRDGAIRGLLAEAVAMPRNHFQVEGMVFDKLTNRTRWAGYRCYRCCHLPRALPLIPPDRTTIRPEHTVVESMESLGHPYTRSKSLYGIHDFEQYYRDVYRKSRVHATKHRFWLLEMIDHWKHMAKDCADYRIALRGVADGLTSLEPPRIDQRDFLIVADLAMRDLGLTERTPLKVNDANFAAVEAILEQENNAVKATSPQAQTTRGERFATRYRHLGAVRLIPYLIGASLIYTGNVIKKLSDKKR